MAAPGRSDRREHAKRLKLFAHGSAGQHGLHLISRQVQFCAGFANHGRGQGGSGCPAQDAAANLVADIDDALAVPQDVKCYPVAAERIIPHHADRRWRQDASVARVLGQSHQGILIEISTHSSRRAASATASRQRSMSSTVL